MTLNFITPTSGTITWDNHPITQQDKQRIGFLPEERGLYQKLTIEEQPIFRWTTQARRADARNATSWIGSKDLMLWAANGQKCLGQKVRKSPNDCLAHFQSWIDHFRWTFSGLDPVNQYYENEIIRMRWSCYDYFFKSWYGQRHKISDQLTMLKRWSYSG